MSVVAGAGVVVLAVSAAGMVGAATGGGRAVDVPHTTAEGWIDPDSGIAHVEPRQPTVEVTRVPPPGVDELPVPDPVTTAPDDGSTDVPSADPAPSPSDDPQTDEAPAADPSPAESEQPTEPATDETDDPASGGTDTEEPDASEESDAPSAAWVQARLRLHGADLDDTGEVDDATVAALREFQRSHDLPVDGTLTAATIEALSGDPAEPVDPPTGEAVRPTAPPTPEPTATTKPSSDPSVGPTDSTS
ncbi:peptidoglycan-binding protein [Cellulosimicrobium terreum]|nr:peptidoglycan-binding protein [Cellulosimicrobium terreum]